MKTILPGSSSQSFSTTLSRIAWTAGVIVAVVFVLLPLVLGSWYTVEQGERGVILRFGKMTEVVDAGLHFKLPFVDGVRRMSIRTQKASLKLAVYSKDVQGADVELSVNFALDPARVGDVYASAGMDYAQRIVLPQLLAKPKDVFGKHNAVNIVQNRELLAAEIKKDLDAHFSGTGIFIQSVQLENIDFSDSYERSVEERMKAEVEVQKVQQNLERERINADMVRARAKGEADAKLARAEADAKAVEIQGRAEASAIEAKARAMRENPEYLKLVQAERWNGELPKTMLPGAAVPMLKID